MNGKQLKNSILQWAIQGKLVPQDPNDEPASVLLERIRAEKARLVKEKKIKKDKNESIIYRGEDNSYYEKFLATGEVKCIDKEIPFEIPQGWEWCRMQDVLEFINGRAFKKDELLSRGKYKVLRVGNFFTNNEWYFSDLELLDDKYCYDGDLLYAWSASFGPQIWEGEKTIFHYHIWNVKYNTDILFRDYLFFFFLYDKTQVLSSTTGSTMAHVSMENMKPRFIPIPTYKEQQRIVSKIEELLPLIEIYERAQNELDVLNTSINDLLKKSILQEAIQGRLVPQISEEGTGKELLAEIHKEKERLVKEGKLKKSALTDSIIFKSDDNKYYEQIGTEVIDITDEIPFEIPKNWIWTRLKNFCSVCTGATFKKEEMESEHCGIRVLRGGNIKPFQLCTKPDDIFIPQSKVKEDILLKHNDIVTPAVTSLENIGKMARVELDMPHTTVGGFVFIIRPLGGGESLSKYLLAFMSSPSAIDFMKSITNKSGQAFYNIGKERLVTALVPIPPLAEQELIVSKIEKLFEQLR